MQDLRATLDNGHDLPFPDGLIINGRGSNGYTFTVDQGTRFRSKINTFVELISFSSRCASCYLESYFSSCYHGRILAHACLDHGPSHLNKIPLNKSCLTVELVLYRFRDESLLAHPKLVCLGDG